MYILSNKYTYIRSCVHICKHAVINICKTKQLEYDFLGDVYIHFVTVPEG